MLIKALPRQRQQQRGIAMSDGINLQQQKMLVMKGYFDKTINNIIAKKLSVIADAVKYKWPDVDCENFCKNYLLCSLRDGGIEIYSAWGIDLVIFYRPIIDLQEPNHPWDTTKINCNLSYKILTKPEEPIKAITGDKKNAS